MIREYFRVWSDQDLDAYGALFMDDACIQYIDAKEQVVTLALGPFLASQRDAHREAKYRQTEVPESIDICFEPKLARVVVYWKLTTGPETTYGYDHFTLLKHREEWRILNLVFYATNRSG